MEQAINPASRRFMACSMAETVHSFAFTNGQIANRNGDFPACMDDGYNVSYALRLQKTRRLTVHSGWKNTTTSGTKYFFSDSLKELT
jgi:hypothetical protein